MNRSSFHFRGFPEFIEEAAEKLGRPELAGAARRVESLAATANLCAQAVETGSERSAEILREARTFCDQLRIAAHAAEAMLEAVEGASPASQPVEATPGLAAGGGRRSRSKTTPKPEASS